MASGGDFYSLLPTGAPVAVIGAIGTAGVFHLLERADRKAAEQIAHKRYAADVRLAQIQDRRDKLRAELEQQWQNRSSQCLAEEWPDQTCNPMRFAVARMKALHAVELPAPRNPPPNLDSLAPYGVVWDTNPGEFKFGDRIIFLEDISQAAERADATTSLAFRGNARDEGYRQRDQDGVNARERVRKHMSEVDKENETGYLGALFALLVCAAFLWGMIHSLRERLRQYLRYRAKKAADKVAFAARAVAGRAQATPR